MSFAMFCTDNKLNNDRFLLLFALSFPWLFFAIFITSARADEDRNAQIILTPEQRLRVIEHSFLQILFVAVYKVYAVNTEQFICLTVLSIIWLIHLAQKVLTYTEGGEEEEEEEVAEILEDDNNNAQEAVGRQELKVFEHYLRLPHEIRMMVIDQMATIDRCKFTRCSKLSNQEANASKNYIYGLKLRESDYSTYISIIHQMHGNTAEGCMMIVKKNMSNKYSVTYESLESGIGNSFCLGRSTIYDEYALRRFKGLLKLHQNKIKTLFIYMRTGYPDRFDFEIHNLKNLEHLEVLDKTDVRHLLEKTRKPLRALIVAERNKRNLKNCDQIYLVQHKFHSPYTKLNKDQFFRLSALEVTINIGSLTEQDICNFISSWQDGTIGKDIKHYGWILNGSRFNVAIVFHCFGAEYDGSDRKTHMIEQNREDGDSAEIFYYAIDSEFRKLSFLTID